MRPLANLLCVIAFLLAEAVHSQLVFREPREHYSEEFFADQGLNNSRDLCVSGSGFAMLNLGVPAGGAEAEPNFFLCADRAAKRILAEEFTGDDLYFSQYTNVQDLAGVAFDAARHFWVADKGAGHVLYFTYTTGHQLVLQATFSGFQQPTGLVYTNVPGVGPRLYVSDPAAGKISVLNPTTGAVILENTATYLNAVIDIASPWNIYQIQNPGSLFLVTKFSIYRLNESNLTPTSQLLFSEVAGLGDIVPNSIGIGSDQTIYIADRILGRLHSFSGTTLEHRWSSGNYPGDGTEPAFRKPIKALPYFNSVAVLEPITGDQGPEIFFQPAVIDQFSIQSALPLHTGLSLDVQFHITGRGEVEFVLHKPDGSTVSIRQLFNAGTHTFQFPASTVDEFGVWSIEAKLRLGDVHSVKPNPTSVLSQDFQVIFPLVLQVKDNGLSESNISKPQILVDNISSTLSLSDFTLRLWLSREEMPSQEIAADPYYFNPGGVQLSVGSDPGNPNLVFVDLRYPSGFSVPPGHSTAADGAQLGLHFRNYYPGQWNRTNDWSWLGMGAAFSPTRRVTVYDAVGTLLFGEEPPLSSVPQPPHLTSADLFGFEKLFAWGAGPVSLSLSPIRTQGASSLQVQGGGYLIISALPLRTQDIAGETSRLALDLLVPGNQPNPYWVGTAQMYVDCFSAGIYNVFLGHVELTGLPQGQFSTLSFDIPAPVLSALQGNHGDFTFKIVLNINSGTQPFLLDNLRFAP